MEMAGLDPQKIAKSENSYLFMVGEVEKALIKEQNHGQEIQRRVMIEAQNNLALT